MKGCMNPFCHLIRESSQCWTAPKGSAQGGTGWRYEHLRAIHNWRCKVPLPNFVRLLVHSRVPPSLRPFLSAARLSVFEKTDDDGVATGGVRPIAMGETIRRWVTRAIVQQKSPELEAALAPCQYAVGVASGSEKLIAAVRTFLSAGEPDERRVLLSLDAKNAFNTMSRQAILEGVDRLFSDLTQYFLQWYGESAELWFHHERGYTCKVSSQEGVQQGDFGGPAWYACGLHGVLEKIRTALPDRLVVAFADNIYIGTTQDKVAHDFDVAENELAIVRQNLVREKCEVWGEHFTKGMDRPANMPSGVCVRDEGLLVLGCPFGTSEFMERHFAKVLKKTQHLIDNLPQLEDPQSAEKLLRFCAAPKFHYHLRTSLPFTRPLAEAAGKHSRALIQAACSLFSLGDIQTKTVRQLKLPLTEGGFGLTDAHRIAPAAYFGAGAVVLADVLARHEGAAWMPVHGRAGLEAQPWGDFGGPAWYACGLHGVLEKIRTALPDRLVVAFADNIYIGTTQDKVAHDFDVAENELAIVRQNLVREKCEVWGEHFTKGMDRPANMPSGVCVRDEGLLVLGCPFGTSKFMEGHFAKVLKKTQHLIDNLPQLEDPQSAEKLLRFCAAPKFHYHLRTSLPFTRPLAEAAGKHSRALIQAGRLHPLLPRRHPDQDRPSAQAAAD
ncbi:unnamed protein product [Vitrella brassicaformis CCMP3155]|uniref:Reverse transcriptase domain-containing protein n=1 Tax=Vitrella brassicaformis (strain CCMP3155) TaxID=1169540 RepID=A0A0G4F5Q1_VITBC|nr:unnamed protein product [Vitrella brassicaformis CCMP3155]|eukprot:CEM07685.1 unnamed protein product [Vitrella brassicaformis CCMP3155]